jgi:formiminotetrahydrofolate cyclodeaminase
MVAKITLKRLKEESNRGRLDDIIASTQQATGRFLSLVNEDTDAFNEIMSSYKLPKDTEENKTQRTASIQTATKHAAEVPLETAKLGVETLSWIKELTDFGNDQTVTDLGVAGLMAHAAITGAVWNVKINLSSIKDAEYVYEKEAEIKEITTFVSESWPEIKTAFENKI